MGRVPHLRVPWLPGFESIVAPYVADIDSILAGIVKHTQFTLNDYSQMSRVSNFINEQTGNTFQGTRMMVAEWYHVGVREIGRPVNLVATLLFCT